MDPRSRDNWDDRGKCLDNPQTIVHIPVMQRTEFATEFEKWRILMGYTRYEAGKRLKVTTRAIEKYEAGQIKPSHGVRVKMRLLAEGKEIEAWPA